MIFVIGVVIGVAVGGVLMIALYELFMLPALVGKPHALGPWPIEAQWDMYERGFQAGAARARAALEDEA